MFGKILVTLAVIIAAVLVLRQRNLNERAQRGQTPGTERARDTKVRDEFSSDMRIAAYMTVVLMLGLGATLYYYRWQDDHTIVTVTLHRENTAQPIRYQVYKFELQERSFVTIDGTSVTVASNERMEIQGLDR